MSLSNSYRQQFGARAVAIALGPRPNEALRAWRSGLFCAAFILLYSLLYRVMLFVKVCNP